MYIRSAKSAC